MNTSLVSDGLRNPPQPSKRKQPSPLPGFFRHFGHLGLADQLSLIIASVIGVILSLILSPLILAIGVWQVAIRFLSK